jgi:hypothetical protein
MAPSKKRVRITVDFPAEELRQVRIAAKLCGETIEEFIIRALKRMTGNGT